MNSVNCTGPRAPFPAAKWALSTRVGSRRRWRADQRGYTAVEILMSLAVLAAGISGVMAMQKVTVASNRHAKNLALATQIGQSWLGLLGAESMLWNETGTLDRAVFLGEAAGSSGDWNRPSYRAAQGFGPGFDALGNALPTPDLTQSRFCVDIRLSPLQDTIGAAGVSRVEVRVIWRREGRVTTNVAPPAHACAYAAALVDGADQSPHLHQLYFSSAVRQVVGR